MGNTTYSGPLRSENGVQLVSKESTGKVHDRTQGLTFPKDARRVYLEEYFKQRPILFLTSTKSRTIILLNFSARGVEKKPS